MSTPFRITTIFEGSYRSEINHVLTASALTSTQSANRHTRRCRRFCAGVRYGARSRIEAMTTGAPAMRAGGIANTLP